MISESCLHSDIITHDTCVYTHLHNPTLIPSVFLLIVFSISTLIAEIELKNKKRIEFYSIQWSESVGLENVYPEDGEKMIPKYLIRFWNIIKLKYFDRRLSTWSALSSTERDTVESFLGSEEHGI